MPPLIKYFYQDILTHTHTHTHTHKLTYTHSHTYTHGIWRTEKCVHKSQVTCPFLQ